MERQAFNLFINNIPHFVFWKDRESNYLGCNEKYAMRLGLQSSSDIIGLNDYDLGLDKDEVAGFMKTDKQVMDSNEPMLSFEEKVTLDTGELRWLSTSKMPLTDDNGKVISVFCWFLDITESRNMAVEIDEKNKAIFQYNLQLEQSKRELELANFDLVDFTNAASHDLKTPVVTIVGFSKLLKRQISDRVETKHIEYIDYIISLAQRMLLLISNLLEFARMGAQNTDARLINLNHVVSVKLKDLEMVINKRNVQVDMDLPEQDVKCFPELIGVVFYNIIWNAIKFNQSEVPKVEITSYETDDFWSFRIKDNGIGIDPDQLDQVFLPFNKLESDQYDGTGFGLSICKRIVSIHKGKIGVENNPEGGVTIYFSISKYL